MGDGITRIMILVYIINKIKGLKTVWSIIKNKFVFHPHKKNHKSQNTKINKLLHVLYR